MALIKCGECGREVSDKAAACPQCGAPVASALPPPAPAVIPPPPKKKSNHIGCLPTTIVIIATLWLVGKCSSSGTTPSAPAAGPAAPVAAVDAEANCRKDLKCWGDKHNAMATVRCTAAVEREAKHQAEWTDDWTEVKFPRFGWADQDKGTLNYLGDKVKFQNGFGAWTNMIYSCTYDPSTEKALLVLVAPRG